MRELMTAYEALHASEPQRAVQWANNLRAVIPEKVYWQVEKEDLSIADLHNWTVYAAAGEALRERAGLAPPHDQEQVLTDGATCWGYDFFAKYMPAQLRYFTEHGMYRDPGDPLTYDLTTRIHLELSLEAGAGQTQPKLHDALNRHLMTGALSTLLLVSPDGLVPFGGRSSQYHMQEIMVALNCEMAANRWLDQDPALAGAFKRQARRSLLALKPWLTQDPMPCLKNSFPPAAQFGYDPYGKYAVYSLLMASLCVLAAQRANDAIAEMPTPAECGGYVFELTPAFHKTIAVCGGTQAVINTAADPHYDATGLGRVCHSDVPSALCLGMPICAEPAYLLPTEQTAKAPAAIGPMWRTEDTWTRLAELAPEVQPQLTVTRQTRSAVAWSLAWPLSSNKHVFEEFILRSGALTYRVDCPGETQLVIPLLINDGAQQTDITESADLISVCLGEHSVSYALHAVSGAQPVTWHIDPAEQANRHGIYRLLAVQLCTEIDISFNRIPPS
jgi:hypothetical protein